jgi:hypothetical protein
MKEGNLIYRGGGGEGRANIFFFEIYTRSIPQGINQDGE